MLAPAHQVCLRKLQPFLGVGVFQRLVWVQLAAPDFRIDVRVVPLGSLVRLAS